MRTDYRRVWTKRAKAVTLIVGLRCADGSVLMCAHREQSDQVAKRSVEKIFRVRLNQGTVLVAGAGRSSILANAFMRLERALQAADSQEGNVLLDTHRDVIETILYEIHEEYIWGRTDENERAIRLIVAASFRSGGSARCNPRIRILRGYNSTCEVQNDAFSKTRHGQVEGAPYSAAAGRNSGTQTGRKN